MSLFQEYVRYETRRQFLSKGSNAVSWAAFAALLGREGLAPSAHAGGIETAPTGSRPPAGRLHFAPKAKQVIYLHMVGGPPQMDMYDYKPQMNAFFDKDLPDSIRMGQRLTTMTSGQKRFPIAPSKYQFARHGKSGMWVCELLPYTARMVDDMCFIRSMHTEAINHEPAITYMQTGNQVTGRPCLARGSPTGWARSTIISRHSWSSWPGRPTPSSSRRSRLGCGRRGICPVSTPVSRFVAVATQSCSSTIRRAFHPR